MQALHALLRQHQDSDLLQFNVKQNHAPMVLIAMYRLGANKEQLQRYYSGLRIEAATNGSHPQQLQPINLENWTQNLGNFSAVGSFCRFFQAETKRIGAEAVLRTYVSPLMSGVTAHAFHPLLRLAYGIDLKDDTEIAFGLAYWAATYLPGPGMPQAKSELAPTELLKKLSRVPSLRSIQPEK